MELARSSNDYSIFVLLVMNTLNSIILFFAEGVSFT